MLRTALTLRDCGMSWRWWGRLLVRGVLYLRLGSLFSLWRSMASLRRLKPCMRGGKRWLSQVNDHEVSAEFEVESGGVVLKLEGAWACRTKAGLEMQMRWAQSHERKLRCRFAVAPKLAQLRAGAIPEAGAQPLDFA